MIAPDAGVIVVVTRFRGFRVIDTDGGSSSLVAPCKKMADTP